VGMIHTLGGVALTRMGRPAETGQPPEE